jgi:hypothetical protein
MRPYQGSGLSDPISSKDFGLRQKHDATLSRIRAVRPNFLEGFWAPPKARCDPIKDQGCQTPFPRRILGSAGHGAQPYQGSRLGNQSERFYVFCKQNKSYRGLIGWLAQNSQAICVVVCKSTEAEQANRQTQSQSALCIYMLVYASLQQQSKPTAKPKAILHCVFQSACRSPKRKILCQTAKAQRSQRRILCQTANPQRSQTKDSMPNG